MKNFQNQSEKKKKINFDAYKFSCNTEVFKAKVLEVVIKVWKKNYHLNVGCLFLEK